VGVLRRLVQPRGKAEAFPKVAVIRMLLPWLLVESALAGTEIEHQIFGSGARMSLDELLVFAKAL